MSTHDLPNPARKSIRWVASRKAAVVRAIRAGSLTAAEACERYGISLDELLSWSRALSAHGEHALRITKAKHFRNREAVQP